jgi:predicted nuclease of restriction endonuclease-like RecB superfamily
VILKQYKQKEIEEIEKVTGARILIVPCKIKYFSWSENIIDDAKSMIFDMKENLNIHKVIKYGE